MSSASLAPDADATSRHPGNCYLVHCEEVRRKNELHKRTEDALAAFGIPPDPISIQNAGAGMTFRFASPHQARKELENRSLFAQGPLGILHAGEVGGVLTEYRSYRNGTRFSLHVVLGRSGLRTPKSTVSIRIRASPGWCCTEFWSYSRT